MDKVELMKEGSMATPQMPSIVMKRYPTLRFLIGIYKAAGVLVLAGSIIFGLYQMITIGGFNLLLGFITMLGTIFSGAVLSGVFWLIAEGIDIVIAIEENTRLTALRTTQVAPPISPAELSQPSITRLLDQLVAGQIQTNQRLDALITALSEMHGNISTGVQTIESIAESSKATATILYRQGSRQA